MITPTPTTGRKSAIGGTAVQVTAVSLPMAYGVSLKAAAANTVKVYVGITSGVTANAADATDGYELSPGDEVFFPVVFVADLSKVYAISTTTGQALFWAAV